MKELRGAAGAQANGLDLAVDLAEDGGRRGEVEPANPRGGRGLERGVGRQERPFEIDRTVAAPEADVGVRGEVPHLLDTLGNAQPLEALALPTSDDLGTGSWGVSAFARLQLGDVDGAQADLERGDQLTDWAEILDPTEVVTEAWCANHPAMLPIPS